MGSVLAQRLHLRRVGQHLRDTVKRSRKYRVVGTNLVATNANANTCVIRAYRIDRCAKMHSSATRRDVGCRLSVELGQRNGGKSHASGFRRLQKRIAKHQCGVAHRNLVEFVIERANEHRGPETIDRLLSLTMSQQPRLKVLPAIGRKPRHQGQQRTRNCQLVL